jgi:3-oxoadipate enol-lactonase
MHSATKSDFTADGVTVHVRGSGAPLVLLHCLGVDHRLWDIAAQELADSYTLIGYDFPGHGTTPVPDRGYAIEDLSRQLARVLTREGIARAHIAGISLGGLVAQHFAATNPERVARLVLIDTTPRYDDAARQMWVERARAARTTGVAALTQSLLQIWFTADFVARDPPAVRYVRACFADASGEGYARACEALAAADLRPLARQIAAPTLVICGSEELPAFREAADWLQRTIPHAALALLSPAKHASVLQQPHAFQQRLRAFLG